MTAGINISEGYFASPAWGAVALNYASADQVFGTQSGTSDERTPRFILLTTAGTLRVDMPDGVTVGVTLSLPAGVWLPIAVTKIYQTGSADAQGFLFF